MSPENLETARAEYQTGKLAFERGDYRKSLQHFETARSLVQPFSQLGGEVQIWLVTTYEALGRRSEALALCKEATRHPDLQTRKQGKRLLYILEAPQLVSRPEWLTQIPDLTNLTDRENRDRVGVPVIASRRKKTEEKPGYQLESVDLSQVNTRDNRFIWVALLAVLLLLGGLLWVA